MRQILKDEDDISQVSPAAKRSVAAGQQASVTAYPIIADYTQKEKKLESIINELAGEIYLFEEESKEKIKSSICQFIYSCNSFNSLKELKYKIMGKLLYLFPDDINTFKYVMEDKEIIFQKLYSFLTNNKLDEYTNQLKNHIINKIKNEIVTISADLREKSISDHKDHSARTDQKAPDQNQIKQDLYNAVSDFCNSSDFISVIAADAVNGAVAALKLELSCDYQISIKDEKLECLINLLINLQRFKRETNSAMEVSRQREIVPRNRIYWGIGSVVVVLLAVVAYFVTNHFAPEVLTNLVNLLSAKVLLSSIISGVVLVGVVVFGVYSCIDTSDYEKISDNFKTMSNYHFEDLSRVFPNELFDLKKIEDSTANLSNFSFSEEAVAAPATSS